MQGKLNQLLGHWGKQRFGGRLLHQSEDAYGEIQVIERRGERALHFGRPEKQSAMLLEAPERLILDYTQAMMSALALLEEPPQRVLFLGLGGGSMVKYLASVCPEARLDVVELRDSVVEVAQEFFALPAQPQLHLLVADARQFLSKVAALEYDLVFIDLFDSEGLAESAQGPGFFRALHRVVAPSGLAVFNFWTEPQGRYQVNHYHLAETFERRIWSLGVADRTNKILFAFGADAPEPQPEQLAKQAAQQELRLQLGLPRWLAQLRHDPFG